MSQILNILDDKVIITKLALTYLEGAVVHAGSFDIIGNASVQSNLHVTGNITADTINVRKLVTDSGSPAMSGEWIVNSETELNGKGFSWTHGTGRLEFMYRTGNRLWCNGDLDLDANSSYKIDNTAVITKTSLGSCITKSNLRTVGNLNTLTVLGKVQLGEFAFFNTVHNRLGIGTESPNAAISIIENNVELAIGSSKNALGNVGTYSNHDLAIITDNIARITVKNTGEIQVGDEINKTGVLRVYGSIYADNIVTDTRLNRTTPLEFTATRDNSIYGKGLIWTGTGLTKQLVIMANPDRLYSSESIDIGCDQTYLINGTVVLSDQGLGRLIQHSSLTTVGALETLTVLGSTSLTTVDANTMTLDTLHINNNIVSTTNIALMLGTDEVFYADNAEIAIGSRQNIRKPVKVFGQMSIGINNPDPTVGLSVSGAVSFDNKKFITGMAVPSTGIYQVGDICWNKLPTNDSYIGWVCVVSGEPGEWLPFGAIARV